MYGIAKTVWTKETGTELFMYRYETREEMNADLEKFKQEPNVNTVDSLCFN